LTSLRTLLGRVHDSVHNPSFRVRPSASNVKYRAGGLRQILKIIRKRRLRPLRGPGSDDEFEGSFALVLAGNCGGEMPLR
jgi:hypothetical protein